VVLRHRTPGLLALLLVTGCAPAAEEPPTVGIQVGPHDIAVPPSQYCLDGEGQRYDTEPPRLEVSPDTPITLTVPGSVADRGWSVQVFDDRLEQPLGEVDVPDGRAEFDEISTSDVVPPGFYLVVVEDGGGECGPFSGAWPVGLIRAGGDLDSRD
jgi:glucose/arabinose dehydrogenase